MFIANDNFTRLPESYLFSEVARKIKDYEKRNPGCDIIRMDIGDVSIPLAPVVIEEMKKALNDMGTPAGFHGYGPEQGYLFLRELIADFDYSKRGISNIDSGDIFISDGAKSDIGNLGDLFGRNVSIGIASPAYPVYIDAAIMAGRAGNKIHLLPCTANNCFKPEIPDKPIDVIYLCYPNNPTGVALSREELKGWIDYALRNKSLIIYDSAYEAYVRDEEIPHSVYEIEGADKVAIEVRSFSKTAGFTGVRCGYTVVPESLDFSFEDGSRASLNKMWNRRQSTKFNGVGYIVQRGAAALYTPEGRAYIKETTDTYMGNASSLRNALLSMGYRVVGGENSPYVWFSADNGMDSWQLFSMILENAHLSSTPGSGFGKEGEGYLRFTGFNTPANTSEAISRLKSWFN